MKIPGSGVVIVGISKGAGSTAPLFLGELPKGKQH